MAADSVDAVVTDPPYGIRFMGKAWDGADIERMARAQASKRPRTDGRSGDESAAAAAGTYDVSLSGLRAFQAWCAGWASEALRVLKPGGHLVAFGGPRAYHRLGAGIEDAGFEVRDSLHWVFGSGFPKSLNLGDGRGTALKPAHEPIILARKPFRGTVATNVVKWGTGGLNVDACRLAPGDGGSRDGEASAERRYSTRGGTDLAPTPGPRGGSADGRWPPNFLLTHAPDCVCVGTRRVATGVAVNRNRSEDNRTSWLGTRKSQTGADATYADADGTETIPAWSCAPGCPVASMDGQSGDTGGCAPASGPTLRDETPTGLAYGARKGLQCDPAFYGDTGGASRFFPTFAWEVADFVPFYYEAKAARSEREAGLDGMKRKQRDESRDADAPGANNPRNRGGQARANIHPTVKPVALMQWLCRLVTPADGVVLDPFLGSGTTGVAALREHLRFIGIEREAEYFAIARRRIEEDAPLFSRRTP